MNSHIERRQELNATEFIARYLVGNLPVIVTDAMNHWRLPIQVDDWRVRFGSQLVQVYKDAFDLTDVLSLGDYLDQFFGNNHAQVTPLPYVRWYTRMKDVDFVWSDDVFRQLSSEWSRPYFLPDHDYLLPYSRECLDPAQHAFPARGLFISGKGGKTRLHHDPWASDAVLCQLYGSKRVLFFEPERACDLERSGVVVDIENPDPVSFPRATSLCPKYEDTLVTGEILFVPRGWFHHVVSISDSISLTWNFVHASTWPYFFQYLLSSPPASELDVVRYFAGKAQYGS